MSRIAPGTRGRIRRAIGPRTLFFAFAALVCLALVPASPPEFRWVAYFAAGLGGFWTVMLAIEDFSTPTLQPAVRRPYTDPGTPFAPPPPPGADRHS
jgi:hypothetical protein